MQALIASATLRPKLVLRRPLPPFVATSRGFTLVEVAVVLVIAGLLMVGLLRAELLIENAKVRKAISQQDAIEQAVLAFETRFGALPGDYDRASEFIDCGSTSCLDGNGNGRVEPGSAKHRHNIKTGNYVPSAVLAEIDRKIDDGLPANGRFQFSSYAGPASPLSAPDCTDVDSSVAHWLEGDGSDNCGAAILLR